MFNSVAELVSLSNRTNKKICEIMIEYEIQNSGNSYEDIVTSMNKNLDVMESAIDSGLKGVSSYSGLTGTDAVLLNDYIKKGKGLSGDLILQAVCNAVATNEVNASMGIICATPTAGSAGVVPGTLFAVKSKLNLERKQMINFLFTAGAFGIVIGNNASISGAEGGCQAEIGSASAMAAAAIVEAASGTAEQCANAAAIAIKNMLGLVCDPVAGLVEVPCIKRNAAGASNALISADMALAGVKSKIPCDEVIEAMYRVGLALPSSLRETAEGGLAQTKTAQSIQKRMRL